MKKLTLIIFLTLSALAHSGPLMARTLTLDYSTYLGGSGSDCAYAITVSSDNCAYITGVTDSANFPTENPYQSVRGLDKDAFVAKLSSTGSFLIYVTYLGGSQTNPYTEPHDLGYNIAVDPIGCAYVVGETRSSDFPTINCYQASLEGSGWSGGGPADDCFITKLSSSGSFLHFSTYLGGTDDDSARDITIDSFHQAYVTGGSYSKNFPIWNSYQPSAGILGRDVFVTKFSSSGSNLIYSTYLGGSRSEIGRAISVDSLMSAYVTGDTESSDFPILSPYQSSLAGNDYDVFIAKFSSTGSNLIYSTYLGGERVDGGHGISIDSAMCAYVTGDTESSNFPTENSYQPVYANSVDVFVSKLSSSGSSLLYSTFLGGASVDRGVDISIDSSNCAHIIGKTNSWDFPVENPYQSNLAGGYDAFITKISSSGSSLIYSTYLGGSNGDEGYGICLDSETGVYVAGRTGSENFPTENPYQSSHAGGNIDACIARLIYDPLAPSPTPQYFVIDSGDYDGNGESDIAIFRPSTGLWAVRGLGNIYFGTDGDMPVSGDYDGDGCSDIGIFNPSTALWAIKNISRFYYGRSGDTSVPGDYDGDGTCDSGIFRADSGLWAIKDITRIYFGSTSDLPVPADYNGDGSSDYAVYRPSEGLWAVRGYTRCFFGSSEDIPVPREYRWYEPAEIIAVFRASTGLWAIRGYTRFYFGMVGDIPVPADYADSYLSDVAIFRPENGCWAILGISRIFFGTSDDLPVSR